MHEDIYMREATSDTDTALFFEMLYAYFKRDIFPDPIADAEDLSYFLDENQYRRMLDSIHSREKDRAQYLLFCKGDEVIGFALTVLYASEDSKCFLMEFCVLPAYCGNGMGKVCAERFLSRLRASGVRYFELNCNTVQRERFWSRLGFIRNGVDEYGVPLMMLPPAESVPFTVEPLAAADMWQLERLENGFLHEIGEDELSDEKKQRLKEAVANGDILFLTAKRGYRAVGMCSIVSAFSTFSCGMCATFEDFFIEPAFRGKGIARMLVTAAKKYCIENDICSLTVISAPCDTERYRSLGFDIPLGQAFACICE